MSISDSSQVAQAKQELVKLLSKEQGFVGAGVASDEAGGFEIVVFVEGTKSAVINRIPTLWKGFSVRTEVSGRPKKLNN